MNTLLMFESRLKSLLLDMFHDMFDSLLIQQAYIVVMSLETQRHDTYAGLILAS